MTRGTSPKRTHAVAVNSGMTFIAAVARPSDALEFAPLDVSDHAQLGIGPALVEGRKMHLVAIVDQHGAGMAAMVPSKALRALVDEALA